MSEKRSIQIVTLGCSKNEVDSEHLLAQIRDEYEIVPAGEERDAALSVMPRRSLSRPS